MQKNNNIKTQNNTKKKQNTSLKLNVLIDWYNMNVLIYVFFCHINKLVPIISIMLFDFNEYVCTLLLFKIVQSI